MRNSENPLNSLIKELLIEIPVTFSKFSHLENLNSLNFLHPTKYAKLKDVLFELPLTSLNGLHANDSHFF